MFIKKDLIICELCGATDEVPEDQDYCNFCYDSAVDEPYEKPKRKSEGRGKVKPETKTYREYAKKFGGKYLAGTIKQKDWAERLRYLKLSSKELTDGERVKLCDVEYVEYTNTATFWIEKRFLSVDALKRRFL